MPCTGILRVAREGRRKKKFLLLERRQAHDQASTILPIDRWSRPGGETGGISVTDIPIAGIFRPPFLSSPRVYASFAGNLSISIPSRFSPPFITTQVGSRTLSPSRPKKGRQAQMTWSSDRGRRVRFHAFALHFFGTKSSVKSSSARSHPQAEIVLQQNACPLMLRRVAFQRIS